MTIHPKPPVPFEIKLKRLQFKLLSRRKRTEKVARVCQRWLNEIGVEFDKDIFQIVSRGSRRVYLVCLHMNGRKAFPPADLLAMRLFLTRKTEEEFCLEPRSIRIVLHLNTEAHALPIDANSLTSAWLHNRISGHRSTKSRTPLEPAPLSSSVIQDLEELDGIVSESSHWIELDYAS